MEKQALEKKLDSAYNSFCPCLKGILKTEVTLDNFKDQIERYVKSKSLIGLEKKIFELFLYLNPKKENFKTESNRTLIMNIFKYMLKSEIEEKNDETKKEESKNKDRVKFYEDSKEEEDKGNDMKTDITEEKKGIDANEIIKLLFKIYKNDNLIQILFSDVSDICNLEEYLEMILLFLPDRETQQITKVIKNNYRGENERKVIDLFQNTIFKKINLKSEKGFKFLKEVLSEYLKDKNNFINTIHGIEKKYIIQNKMLRCVKCFNLPFFSINEDKKINISYKCKHDRPISSDKLQDILDYRFQCSCDQFLLDSYKNYICSNCQSIVCSLCLNNHFANCVSIFFIPMNEIDIKCAQHNEKFEAYCGLCEINLCKICCQEHFHYVEKEKDIILSEKDIITFKEIIKKYKISDNLLSSIENIVEDKLYIYDFQFFHFVRKVLGNDKINSKLFNEFFGEEFKNYYKYMISGIQSDNHYYLNLLKQMHDYYSNLIEKENIKINANYSNFYTSNFLTYLENKSEIMNNNMMKFSLALRYFQAIYDIKVQMQILNQNDELKTGLINIQENNILAKCILSSETLYQQELLKLIDRSIAENIIIYLIQKFPLSFAKIDFNLNIYNDLEKLYKNEQEKLNKIKSEYKEKINKFFSEDNQIEKGNKIIFEKSITYGKASIPVKELNKMLEFLFYIKGQGNFTAHPKTLKTFAINPYPHKNNILNKKDNPEEAKNKIEQLFKYEFMKRNFNSEVFPKDLLDCLFKYNFKPLVNCENDGELDNKIDEILNGLLIEMNGMKKDEKMFENYLSKEKQLEEIKKEFDNINKENNLIIPKKLKGFFERLDKVLDNEKSCISFLYRLNSNKYESSIIGKYYEFYALCLNYIITKKLVIRDEEINEYHKAREETMNLIESKNKIIFLLTNLNEKLKNLDNLRDYEPIINEEKITEYVNKAMNSGTTEKIDLAKIRETLAKLVTKKIDWTASKNCSLSTLLFLEQNNK